MNLKTFLSSARLAVASGLLLSVFPSVVRADDASDEARQITILQSQSSPREKDAACVWLKRHGTAKSVPALAALLTDEQLSLSARYALETMPSPAAEKALIAALSQTSGLLKAGVINSLGLRHDPQAVPELAKLFSDPDNTVAHACAVSLGDIATPDALKALEAHLDDSDASKQGAAIDACLRCAQHFQTSGNRKKALATYQEIFKRPTKEFYHVAAYRGMVLASGAKGVDLIVDSIVNGPAALQMEAIQLVHEKQIPGVTKAVAQALPKLDPLVQVALIDALAQRDDPDAVPQIVELTTQSNPDVRAAAVAALGTLGSGKDVPLLVEIAATAGDSAQAPARQALGLVHRGNPDKALLDLLSSSKPEAQVEIIRALSARSATGSIPQLLQLAQQADGSVRDATFQALAHMADQSQLATLAQLVGQMTTADGRVSAAAAVVAACRHIQRQHGSVDMTPVWGVLKNGSPDARVALFPVCSTLTSPESEAILRNAVADSNANVREAAVRALCDATDPALVPDVVKLATDPSYAEFRPLALESFVRLTTQEDTIKLSDADRIKLFQTVTPVASNASEKRVVLSGLAAIPDPGSLQLAQPFLSDTTVSSEAARAVISICRKLPDAEAARTALEKFISQATSDEAKQDATAALKIVDARSNYITAWEFAGPYREAGKNFRALFEIPFAPETADAQSAGWRNLPLSDDPDSPWAMDFLKQMGGEQEVAYARTSIHCADGQDALLFVNSDDGVKIWLNGEVVHANNATRALTSPPDKVKITLKPGWNNLLLKVTQNNAGWGFCARLTSLDGSQLKSVQYAASPAHTQM